MTEYTLWRVVGLTSVLFFWRLEVEGLKPEGGGSVDCHVVHQHQWSHVLLLLLLSLISVRKRTRHSWQWSRFEIYAPPPDQTTCVCVCVRECVGGDELALGEKIKNPWREIRGKHPDIDWMQSCGRLPLSHTPINQANHSTGCFSAMMTMKCRERGRPNPLPKDTTRGGKQFIVCVQLVQWNEKKTENIVSNWITWRPNGKIVCRNSIAKRQSYSQKSVTSTNLS